MSTLAKWQAYWQGQTTPLYGEGTDEYHQRYAAELKILFADIHPQRVLEIGCGNGALYPYMGLEQAQYKGIDFSDSMLALFKKEHPQVELECADGASYQDDHKYDLIISMGVVQYFNHGMLENHFINAKSMMHSESRFICASVPWKTQRFNFYVGDLALKRTGGGLLLWLRSLFLNRLGKMGTWYSLRDFRKLAGRYSMSVKFFGSVHYMYRFHAVMKPK
ncbi:MAG: class I SAM-dependent methyltransferase [Anaerolineae bacterium]|nr:class I SAM-dependent methyltransferase [Anaerolineae bacterium]